MFRWLSDNNHTPRALTTGGDVCQATTPAHGYRFANKKKSHSNTKCGCTKRRRLHIHVQKKNWRYCLRKTLTPATDSGYCLCMENGGREKDFEGRVTYNRRRGETSMAGIKAHTRVQTVSQRRPELISPQLQQEQPAENSTIFTIRLLVAGLPFFTSIEMHTRIAFQSTLI